jgi:ankyrin repeat protein
MGNKQVTTKRPEEDGVVEDNSPLCSAVKCGDTETVRLLVQENACGDVADSKGSIPLHRAALLGDIEMVRLLLKVTSNVDATTHGGRTSLWYALWKDNRECAVLLMDNGAKIELVKLSHNLSSIPQWALDHKRSF